MAKSKKRKRGKGQRGPAARSAAPAGKSPSASTAAAPAGRADAPRSGQADSTKARARSARSSHSGAGGVLGKAVRRYVARHTVDGEHALVLGDGEMQSKFSAVPFLDVLLRESQSNGYYRQKIRLPDGTEREADVARVGMMLWAYRAVDDGSVGIAMDAPGSDESFRWFSNLKPEITEQLAALFDSDPRARARVMGMKKAS